MLKIVSKEALHSLFNISFPCELDFDQLSSITKKIVKINNGSILLVTYISVSSMVIAPIIDNFLMVRYKVNY